MGIVESARGSLNNESFARKMHFSVENCLVGGYRMMPRLHQATFEEMDYDRDGAIGIDDFVNEMEARSR